MARTDAAKDLDDRSMLSQNMEYTKTVSRTLKPDLERHFEDQAAPSAGALGMKRSRGDFTQADQRGDSIGLESSQGGTGNSGRSARAMRPIVRLRSLHKDSGDSFLVSTNPDLFGELSCLFSHQTDAPYVES